MRRVSEALGQLAKRVGFRIIPGLGERVIYRELFPKGLTMLDSKDFGDLGLSHVAARQELREMMPGLALPQPTIQLCATACGEHARKTGRREGWERGVRGGDD